MSDIVRDLRSFASDYCTTTYHDELVRNAADEIERLSAEYDALIEFLQKQGLLVHLKMCTRPDNTLGPAWVLHRVWSVDGGSCLGWHEDDPRAAVAAAEIGRRMPG